jgi:hypothetical protein
MYLYTKEFIGTSELRQTWGILLRIEVTHILDLNSSSYVHMHTPMQKIDNFSYLYAQKVHKFVTYMFTKTTKSSIHLVSPSTPTPTKYTGFLFHSH